jgi:pimeloyl-ACP methyl ester carboxylesterase
MAADIDNYLEERGVKKNEKIVLVGHSMGGKVAMTFACMWPKRVTGLVSLD